MAFRPLFLALGLLLWAINAGAERVLYKHVDAEGKVTYSDRSSGAGDTRVKNWVPARLGRQSYDAAVMRAESDRYYYARLLAERRQPVPVAVYDPRGWQEARSRSAYAPTGGMSRRARWDPNLPVTPAPSLERNYYYGGR
jgi:hypothetical protein